MNQKRLMLVLIAIAFSATALFEQQSVKSAANTASAVQQQPTSSQQDALERAFVKKQSDLQLEGVGVVHKLLADDLKGSRHQRFILKLASGRTLLVAHNIDLAQRINSLAVGDQVQFYGEYEWNERGGVLHWTHHDPKGRHIDGWLLHKGNTYQ